jgi:transposase
MMSGMRRRYDEEFKKNAVALSYAGTKSVAQVASDLGISDGMLYRWRQKYTPNGDKTRYATMEEELKALKLENAELKMERDMLKKASAYFASLHK